MKLLGDNYGAKYFAMMSSHCAFTRRGGHGHDYHGNWSSWAASLCGPEVRILQRAQPALAAHALPHVRRQLRLSLADRHLRRPARPDRHRGPAPGRHPEADAHHRQGSRRGPLPDRAGDEAAARQRPRRSSTTRGSRTRRHPVAGAQHRRALRPARHLHAEGARAGRRRTRQALPGRRKGDRATPGRSCWKATNARFRDGALRGLQACGTDTVLGEAFQGHQAARRPEGLRAHHRGEGDLQGHRQRGDAAGDAQGDGRRAARRSPRTASAMPPRRRCSPRTTKLAENRPSRPASTRNWCAQALEDLILLDPVGGRGFVDIQDRRLGQGHRGATRRPAHLRRRGGTDRRPDVRQPLRAGPGDARQVRLPRGGPGHRPPPAQEGRHPAATSARSSASSDP